MSTDSSDSLQVPIRCFLSYAHADDAALNFITPLKESLEHFCYSDSGRRLEVFLDREAIGWGENWRNRIAESVNSAMVFIPIASGQYFDREACRTELQAFHAAAKNRGVTDLLLPLLILGNRFITSTNDDPLVRIIEELQYVDVRDAILAGAATREWRTTMVDVAHKLVAAVERVESTLQEAVASPTGNALPEISQDDDTQLGLQELEARLAESAGSFAGYGNDIVEKMGEITALLSASAARMDGATPEIARMLTLEFANNVTDMSADIQRLGTGFEAAVSSMDADTRQYHSLVMQFGTAEMKASVRNDLRELGSQLSELNDTARAMEDFLEQIRPIEIMNAALRKALRPLRAGVMSMQVALSTAQSWGQLAD